MPVTIHNFAKRQTIPAGAVSRMLSRYTDIAEDTRQRILNANHEMGYTPNRAARQRRKQSTGMTIGYIMPGYSPLIVDAYFIDDAPACIEKGDLTSAGGYATTKRLLSIPDPPNAVHCVNDATAFGALRAIDEAGLKTGHDIAVAGFDGVRDTRYCTCR